MKNIFFYIYFAKKKYLLWLWVSIMYWKNSRRILSKWYLFQKIDKCNPNCRGDEQANENNTNCKKCPSVTILYYGNCISNCKNGFFYQDKEKTSRICKCDDIKCFYCSKEAYKSNLCDSCNNEEGYYPKKYDSNNIGKYINCYKSPDKYYLDNNDNYYKDCYYSCKNYYGAGNLKNNICKECENNFKFINDFENDNNCYEDCEKKENIIILRKKDYYFALKIKYVQKNNREKKKMYRYMLKR